VHDNPRFVVRILVAILLFAIVLLTGCVTSGSTGKENKRVTVKPSSRATGDGHMATIYLAGGCFWGVEKYIASINGVLNTEVGYANGRTDSPTYGEVSTGLTGDAETVRVDYDPTVAPLGFLLDLFYKAIDPTSVNRQGNDVGTQYRSGIFYSDDADRAVIEQSIAKLQGRLDKPVAIQVTSLTSFTPAEEYHQDYLEKNPGGYCHIGGDLFKNAAEAVPDASYFETPPAQ